MGTRRFLVAITILVAIVASACSSSSQDTTSTTSVPESTFVLPDLEFGRGSMPPSIPSSFPTPEQAVVGATMMAGTRNVTEVILTYPADVPAVVAFYTNNLPVLGYQVDGSSGAQGNWTVTFSGEDLSGEIKLETIASSLTAGTLLFTHS